MATDSRLVRTYEEVASMKEAREIMRQTCGYQLTWETSTLGLVHTAKKLSGAIPVANYYPWLKKLDVYVS